MKQIFLVLSMVMILFIPVANAANRGEHPRSADRNYVEVCTIENRRNSPYVYLNKKSIEVQTYKPPHYQIAGVFSCDADSGEYEDYKNYLEKIGGKEYGKGRYEFFYYLVVRYNFNTKESFHLQNGHWVKDSTEVSKKNADALFKVAYNMNFY